MDYGRMGKTAFLFRLLADLKLIVPLIKDYCTGKYRKIPILSIVGIFFTILYLINPFDLIPDYLLGIGQIDDAVVLAICLFLVERDLQEYGKWKAGESDRGEKTQ